MALDELAEKQVVSLDADRKAALVSNLLQALVAAAWGGSALAPVEAPARPPSAARASGRTTC